MKKDDYREVPLTLVVSLTFWAGAVAAGTSAGVFLRLSQESYAALCAFATLFAASVVLIDARVRGWLAARGAPAAWTATLGLSVLLVASGVALPQARGAGFAAAPWAPMLLFGVPVTVAAALAAIRSALGHAAPRTARAVQMAGD
jgi:hypothetical protein